MIRFLIKSWLPLAIASTVIMLTIYAVVQQSIRQGGNDPQIQMAEDAATMLGNGYSPALLTGEGRVDMQMSLAPFVIVYDDAGKTLASTGFLNNEIPVVPAGVLDFTRSHADDRITWQPASTTRIAAVVKHFSGKSAGFVLVGRNMRELEDRESQIGLIVLAAWIGLLVLTFIVSLYGFVSTSRVLEEM